ncbi:MAG: hypothetical protein ACTSR8_19720 [Promethearchaeota archaeon]
MPIKVFEGRIQCSICEKLLDNRESFKLNEFQHEIACLECDEKSDFSKHNYVNYTSPKKRFLLKIIYNAMKGKNTISIDLKKETKKLAEDLSSKIRAIY